MRLPPLRAPLRAASALAEKQCLHRSFGTTTPNNDALSSRRTSPSKATQKAIPKLGYNYRLTITKPDGGVWESCLPARERSLLSENRWHPMRQQLEQQLASYRTGRSFNWNVSAPPGTSMKTFVRNYLNRRIRRLFKEALAMNGYDVNGRVVMQSGDGSREAGGHGVGSAWRERGKVAAVKRDLHGDLLLNARSEFLIATDEDLLDRCRTVAAGVIAEQASQRWQAPRFGARQYQSQRFTKSVPQLQHTDVAMTYPAHRTLPTAESARGHQASPTKPAHQAQAPSRPTSSRPLLSDSSQRYEMPPPHPALEAQYTGEISRGYIGRRRFPMKPTVTTYTERRFTKNNMHSEQVA